MMRIRVTVLTLLALISLVTLARPLARNDQSLDQLIARAESAPPRDRPGLYLQIARQQAETADKLYQAGDPGAGNGSKRCGYLFRESQRRCRADGKETERYGDCPAQDGGEVSRRQAQPPF